MSLFPEIEPYQKSFIEVSAIHKIYYEVSGNPKGIPMLFLHGGPGGGTEPIHRRLYDPQKFKIILIDQRGCGLSTPHAETRENTTWDLVNDIEKIRELLQIDQWFVHGGSWGTTLALVYAINHPKKVLGMVLRGIFLCSREELEWFYQEGAHWLFPEEWEKYKQHIPEAERNDFITAYHKRLMNGQESDRLKAAKIWSRWEAATSKLEYNQEFVEQYEEPKKALAFATIESHYFFNKAFLPSNHYIMENISKIDKIPISIVHGRYDVVCPVKNAWDLHQKLPLSQLKIIPTAGHSLFEPEILKSVMKFCHEIANVPFS